MTIIRPTRIHLSLLAVLVTGLTLLAPAIQSADNWEITVEQARARALEFNRTYLAAEKNVELAQVKIGKARSSALPFVSAGATYNRDFKIASVFFEADGEIEELKFGFKNSFGASLSVTQPIWHGGKVFTALKIAKLYRNYAEEGLARVASEVIFNSDRLLYSVVLHRSRLEVLNQALQAADENLTVIEKFFDQGMVSKFELLRAGVAKGNLEPALLQAESNHRLARKRLQTFLGIDLSTPILVVTDANDTTIGELLSLDRYVETALDSRPEMSQANLTVAMSDKAIRVARGGYLPSLDAFTTYGWRSESDKFTLSGNNSESWTAGLRLSIPIFSGGLTRQQVTEAIIMRDQARLAEQDLVDQIRLEVEASWDQMVQAKKALQIQELTVAQAEEGLRIANLRYESGKGTLLETLSAQTALTEARNAKAQALFAFRIARSQLTKASTIDI